MAVYDPKDVPIWALLIKKQEKAPPGRLAREVAK
jgi:hypothetical protein